MHWLTEDARLACDHNLGILLVLPTQDLVTIAGRRVLVEPDPVSCQIAGCPNLGAQNKPCLRTLTVEQGYSAFVRINGRSVCLDAVTGKTDGTPPGTVCYTVRNPGQDLVGADQ